MSAGNVEPELLHTYSKVAGGVLFVIVRLAVLVAVTLTVPIVIFPVSVKIMTLTISHYSYGFAVQACISYVETSNI